MGATLEQFDLTPARTTAGCRASATRRSCSTAPTSSRASTRSMLEAGARRRRDRHLPGQPPEARRVGPRRAHARDQPQGRGDRAQGRRRGALRRRLDRADRPPARLRRPDARQDHASASSSTSSPSRPGPRRGRRRPADHRDRAGHPRGQGRDLRRARGVHGRPAAACRSRLGLALPNGGKMLLGTDIDAVLTTLEALDVDVIGLNCSTGPEDMRDAIRFLGEHSPRPGPLHPERRPAAPGPGRRDDLPRGARAARRRARRVRRALRRLDRRRLLRHDARAHRGDRRARAAAARAGERPAPARAARSSSMMTATPLVQEPRADARRRARQLAGLAQGQGAAARRRLRRPRRRSPRTRSRAARTCSTSASR